MWVLHPAAETRHLTDRVSLAEMGDLEETPEDTYPLPEVPARHAPKSGPPPTSRAAPAASQANFLELREGEVQSAPSPRPGGPNL